MELRKLGCDGFEHAFRRRIEGTYFTPEGNQKDYEFDVLWFHPGRDQGGIQIRDSSFDIGWSRESRLQGDASEA